MDSALTWREGLSVSLMPGNLQHGCNYLCSLLCGKPVGNLGSYTHAGEPLGETQPNSPVTYLQKPVEKNCNLPCENLWRKTVNLAGKTCGCHGMGLGLGKRKTVVSIRYTITLTLDYTSPAPSHSPQPQPPVCIKYTSNNTARLTLTHRCLPKLARNVIDTKSTPSQVHISGTRLHSPL